MPRARSREQYSAPVAGRGVAGRRASPVRRSGGPPPAGAAGFGRPLPAPRLKSEPWRRPTRLRRRPSRPPPLSTWAERRALVGRQSGRKYNLRLRLVRAKFAPTGRRAAPFEISARARARPLSQSGRPSQWALKSAQAMRSIGLCHFDWSWRAASHFRSHDWHRFAAAATAAAADNANHLARRRRPN